MGFSWVLAKHCNNWKVKIKKGPLVRSDYYFPSVRGFGHAPNHLKSTGLLALFEVDSYSHSAISDPESLQFERLNFSYQPL